MREVHYGQCNLEVISDKCTFIAVITKSYAEQFPFYVSDNTCSIHANILPNKAATLEKKPAT